MQFVEVNDKESWKLFHKTLHLIYQDDPKWICPLNSDIEAVFDPSINKAVVDGETILYVLLDDKGQPAGRIAAFIDHERNKAMPYPIGGIGFFECINNREYAFALFEKAAHWLKEKGARAIDGPINFGERDKFWGLLVKGFYPPLFQENYNPPYYKQFFDNWGFLPFEQILTYKGDTSNIPVDRLGRIAERMRSRYNITTESLNYKEIDRFANDFCEVYNAAFIQFGHFKPILPQQVIDMLQEARPIVDTNLMAMTYFEGKPAGFCALFPDINPLLRAAKGKLNWKALPGFLLRRRFTRTFSAKGIGFGIHPEYRSKGTFGVMVAHMSQPANQRRYPFMYLTTVRAHNKPAVSSYEKLVVDIDRIHIAYRKPLEEGLAIEPFEFAVDYNKLAY